MAAEERQWIVIRNWHRFQHYRDRQPAWIKLYTELLDTDEWRDLPVGTRSLLCGLWLAFASTRGQLRLDTASLSRRLSQRVTKQQLDALNHAGFIEFSASRPLAIGSTNASPRATRANALARGREEQDLEQEQVGKQASLRGDQQPEPAPPPLPDLQTVNGAIGEPPTHLPAREISPEHDPIIAAGIRRHQGSGA